MQTKQIFRPGLRVGALAVSALFILGGCAARAQDVGNLRSACKADLAKYCKDVKPGGGRILQCLQAQKDQLAPDCKTALDKLVADAKGRRG